MRESAYHPDFGADVRYKLERLPESPDAQVEATIARMVEYLNADMHTAIIREFAAQAISVGEGDPILGLWRIVKQSMRFQEDERTARRLETKNPDHRAMLPDVIEVLIRPVDQALLIKLRGMGFEDCDGFELFACCVLGALAQYFGYPIRPSLVTVSADQNDPYRFSHVYAAAYIQKPGPDGMVRETRIPLDFSHGEFPGWECPNTGRLREWPIDGTLELSRAATLANGLIAAALLVGAYFGVRFVARQTGAIAA